MFVQYDELDWDVAHNETTGLLPQKWPSTPNGMASMAYLNSCIKSCGFLTCPKAQMRRVCWFLLHHNSIQLGWDPQTSPLPFIFTMMPSACCSTMQFPWEPKVQNSTCRATPITATSVFLDLLKDKPITGHNQPMASLTFNEAGKIRLVCSPKSNCPGEAFCIILVGFLERSATQCEWSLNGSLGSSPISRQQKLC